MCVGICNPGLSTGGVGGFPCLEENFKLAFEKIAKEEVTHTSIFVLATAGMNDLVILKYSYTYIYNMMYIY